MSKKILFLVAHRPGRSPGQRFRFEQYLQYLRQNGFQFDISYLIDEKDDIIFYANGRFFQKALFLFKSIQRRFADLKRARNYQLVFLYREAHMLGTSFFEKRLRRMGAKIILDFDDSIWLKDISQGNKNLSFLKRPEKTSRIISLCHTCIVGNSYLANYALKYNSRVFIIPTTIDTKYYTPPLKTDLPNEVVIGWTGSSTTLKHFSLAVPVLRRLKLKYKDRIRFLLISDEPYQGNLEGLTFIKWKKETEVADLAQMDIGIMPLPDDSWSKGKCGFKGLQYMALKIPAVMSPVGVNNEIIIDGENGFLADSPQSWERILSGLIEDESLRKKIGERGRVTVEQAYSFASQKENYLKIFENALAVES